MKKRKAGVKIAVGLGLAAASLVMALSWMRGTMSGDPSANGTKVVASTAKIKTEKSVANRIGPKTRAKPAVAQAKSAPNAVPQTAAMPVRCALTEKARILDERMVKQAPALKGGRPRFRKEWLIEDGGMKIHLDETYEQGDNGEMKLVASHEYAADRVMLTMDGEKDFEAFRKVLAMNGYTVRDPLMRLAKNGKIVSVTSPTVSLDTVADLQKAVANFDRKLTVETDDILRVNNRIPSDLRYPQLWGMDKIAAPRAWDTRTDASSVVVAVIDTGVNYNHEDLSANMWTNPNPGSYSGYTGDLHGINVCNGTGSPLDDNGHGSHCAGTIGAVGDNRVGVAGVVWNVKIMALKFLNASGSGYTSDSIVCYDYAKEHGADVVSCSFGGGGYSSSVRSAIAALKAGNTVVACAAGNDWTDNDAYPQYPSNYEEDNIVAVASTGTDDVLSWFSNFGATSVDIAAPGEDIVSTYCTSASAYATLSGTSMATPHVAGALAMIKAHFPGETYQQTIQRLYASGDTITGLKDVISTGRRLNVANALAPVAPVAPTVTATMGDYSDKVAVSWTEVSGATHYKLWRALSETDEKSPLTGWTTDVSFDDTTAAEGTTYYYFAQAATDASGANASDYGVPAAGYVRRAVRDAWDPTDDTPAGATLLVMSQGGAAAVHAKHTLNVLDPYDWFQVEMTPGSDYVFESTGRSDTYVEVYSADDLENRIDYDDDGGETGNFRLSFRPEAAGVYYLRIRCYDTSADGEYDLQYSCADRWDAWDPADDTTSGATEIAVGDAEGSHEGHTLSVSDGSDFFKVELEKGYTYTFCTTGDSDTYGELYAGENLDSDLVEYDDDSGDSLNFRLTYTPETSGTYYLRVRQWCDGADADYDLHFSRAQTDYNLLPTPYSYYNPLKGWEANPFLTTNLNAVVGSTLFAADDTIFMRWAFNEESGKGVGKPVTNLVEILDVDGVRLMWGHAVYSGDIAGQFVDFLTEFPSLPTGSYMARITLNSDVWGNHTIVETDYSDNEMLVGFTVMAPAKRLTGLSISGNSEVESKHSTEYRCTATYSDTTEETVVPEWTISSGAAYADIAADGTLTAGVVSEAQTAVIVATFQGLTATKTVTITPERREHVSPFDPTVFYPNAPMIIVRGVVYIDGRLAAEGDEVAAFGKSANGSAETRGYAKIEKEGRFSMPVYLARGAERITFKTCDVSAGDDGEVLVCMQTYIGVPGSFLGSFEKPVRLDACSWDPFGDPIVADTEAATLVAKVTIDGAAASSGDILAVYDGASDSVNGRLVGKQIIVFGNDGEFNVNGANASFEARCTVYLYLTPGEHNLSFKVWDRNGQRELYSYTRCRIEPGQTVGTEDDPFLVEALTLVRQDLSLGPKGWHLVSFNVLPDVPSNTPQNVFNVASNDLQTVLGPMENGMWFPQQNWSTLTNISFGSGYWVFSTADDVAWRVEGHWSTDVEYSLAEGWNLIGYPLPRAGRIDAVLADLMASGAVEQIIGETASYPNGNLDVFQPGQAYWVKAARACAYRFNWTGMMNDAAARASAAVNPYAYGPFGSGRNVTVGAQGAPVLYDRIPVTVFGQSANPGDCVAVYAGTDLVAAARVENEDGFVSFPVYAVADTKLSIRVWTISSGLENPVIYDADEQLTMPQAGTVVRDVAISVTQGTGKDGFTVTFDLGEHAVAFAGETNQVVAFGESATAPVVTCEEGYAFLYWDKPFVNVRAATTVKAVYGQIKPVEPTPPPPGPDGQVTNVMLAVSKAGWHEMSFPVLPTGGDPASVFAPVEDKIGYVTSGSLNWNPATGGTLVSLEIGKGYWVQTTVPNVTWAVVGQGNPTVEIALKPGWNLIGYPLLEEGETEVVLASALATGKILYICSESKVYPGTLTTLVPGKGYWVYANEAATIRFDAD